MVSQENGRLSGTAPAPHAGSRGHAVWPVHGLPGEVYNNVNPNRSLLDRQFIWITCYYAADDAFYVHWGWTLRPLEINFTSTGDKTHARPGLGKAPSGPWPQPRAAVLPRRPMTNFNSPADHGPSPGRADVLCPWQCCSAYGHVISAAALPETHAIILMHNYSSMHSRRKPPPWNRCQKERKSRFYGAFSHFSVDK